ncbi:AraC family transcriptional regulator [Caballeronia sp. LZ034LL]|uniref:AraC family transcriptional regulator n=1 Tax=Caballeronia sp. LZ034LL TaxID=3038567 RepID=UPI002867361E|nr:AraC family transcriptional regulator [Caballeronia sp. LZ034LL]MDR5837351.1 AraC family transcriptional regulator [Caballeronia sp. LZ034LL]
MDGRRQDNTLDWVRRAVPGEGIERIEAWFGGKAYGMHRHDTYAIGRTLAGVQSFNYRRGLRNSIAGQTMVLHPDEAHDGQAGTGEGFRYRMLYVDPALIQAVLGGRALPFIEGGLTTDPRVSRATEALLRRTEGPLPPLEPLERHDALTELALALAQASGARLADDTGDYASAVRAHDFLHAHCDRIMTLDELERVTGRDRFALSRDFRKFYGTSPYRYLTLRRLDLARRLMLAGAPLADVAAQAGFADQSHMTRQFTRAYGMPPARWRAIAAQR